MTETEARLVEKDGICFNDYLKTILTGQQIKDLKRAVRCGHSIIVKGEQITGKSTLVEILQARGVNAVEIIPFETVEISLNKPLEWAVPSMATRVI